MKNCLAVLGIVLLSAVAASAQTPPTTPSPTPEPVLMSHETCGPLLDTGARRASGLTCSQAVSNVQSTLINVAACGECGFCFQYFTYGACEIIQGAYSVPANLKYRCRICEA